MQRESIENYYSDYIAGDLDAALQLSVENHLKASPEAAAEVDALRRAMATLNEMPSTELPIWFHDNLMNRLDMKMANEAAQQKQSGWNWRTLFQPRSLARGAAAVMTLVVIGGVGAKVAGINPFNIFSIFSSSNWASTEAMARAAHSTSVRGEWRPDNNGTAYIRITVPQGYLTDKMVMGYQIESLGTKISVKKTGTLTSGQEEVITIACENPPAGSVKVGISSSFNNAGTLTTYKPVTLTLTP